MTFTSNTSSLPTPLIALLLTLFLPTAAATNTDTAGRLDTAGFWISFALLVVVSAVESAFSFFWTRGVSHSWGCGVGLYAYAYVLVVVMDYDANDTPDDSNIDVENLGQ